MNNSHSYSAFIQAVAKSLNHPTEQGCGFGSFSFDLWLDQRHWEVKWHPLSFGSPLVWSKVVQWWGSRVSLRQTKLLGKWHNNVEGNGRWWQSAEASLASYSGATFPDAWRTIGSVTQQLGTDWDFRVSRVAVGVVSNLRAAWYTLRNTYTLGVYVAPDYITPDIVRNVQSICTIRPTYRGVQVPCWQPHISSLNVVNKKMPFLIVHGHSTG